MFYVTVIQPKLSNKNWNLVSVCLNISGILLVSFLIWLQLSWGFPSLCSSLNWLFSRLLWHYYPDTPSLLTWEFCFSRESDPLYLMFLFFFLIVVNPNLGGYICPITLEKSPKIKISLLWFCFSENLYSRGQLTSAHLYKQILLECSHVLLFTYCLLSYWMAESGNCK